MKNYLLKYALFLLLCSGCKIADLQTSVAKQHPNETNARELLEAMAVAHGADKWSDVATYTVNFEDEFYGFFGKQGHPFPDHSIRFDLSYIPNSFDGQLKFVTSKKKGEIWGIQSWQTYRQKVGEELAFKKDKEIAFWLPTYQYFLEFPARIQKATALAYAGRKEIGGVDCEGILASWNTTDVQKETDQYLIWINRKTKQIVKLEYTVREKFKWLTGAAWYKGYKNYEGILLPSKMTVESNIKKKGNLHEMRILGFQKNSISKDQLQPNKQLENKGDAKGS